MTHTAPCILVLLATHNGEAFLPEQLASVLAQRSVDLRVVVSDDASTDGTPALLERTAKADARVTLLSSGRFGSAAANFFRLIREVDASGFDAVAFCDQDDRWDEDKLERQANLLAAPAGLDGRGAYSAVSSNVTAFNADGSRQLIMKSQPQRRLDYAFESGGPGSTFLLRADAFRLLQQRLRDPASAAPQASAHDWLAYAIVRAAGGRWHIDAHPTVDYRQHGDNVLGANEGYAQHLRRLRAIASGGFRRNCATVVAAALEVACEAERPRLEWLAQRLHRCTIRDRVRLVRRAREFRRRRRDQFALAAAIALGVF